MPSSTRSNKEKSLLFSDTSLLEHTIRKEKRYTSIDNNISSSTDTCQQMSTDTPNPLTDICTLPPIDTSTRTSIDIRSWDMVETLILECDENGDMHDQEGHLRIAAGQRLDDQRAVISWSRCWSPCSCSSCRRGCSTKNVGWLKPSMSILRQQICYSSSGYSEDWFRAETPVLYTRGANGVPEDYGPSGAVRGSGFCY